MADDTNKTTAEAEEQLGFDADEFSDKPTPPTRREPVFGGFEEEDYEEPERDTDYASRYVEDDLGEVVDERVADFDEVDEPELDWGEEEDEVTARHSPDEEDNEQDWQSGEDEDPEEGEYTAVSENAARGHASEEEAPWEEDDYDGDYELEDSRWPIGLVAVGLLAVILLAAGGYGVLQQRAATEEEIRQLRAELATAVQPEEVIVDNSALEEAQKKNIELAMNMESLKLENRRLQDTVAGLEAQLDAQQEALSRPAPPPPKPEPPAAKPAATKVAAPETGGSPGSWFVNFSSYSQRGSADEWVAKLKPSAGRAVVTTGTRDGKTFYRVRIIELADKATAEKVARQLESEYGLSKLWVGK